MGFSVEYNQNTNHSPDFWNPGTDNKLTYGIPNELLFEKNKSEFCSY